MKDWFYACRHAAELMSQAMDEPLPWLVRLRLRAHLSMCRNCQRVEQQLHALRGLGTGLFSGADLEPPADDPPKEDHPSQGSGRR